MLAKISLTFLLIFISNFCIIEGFFEYCDHTYSLEPYGKAYINSPYYSTIYTPNTCMYPSRLPCRYPAGSSCRYQVIAPVDFNINIQCNISFYKDEGQICNTEYFYVSVDGDKEIRSGESLCGRGVMSRKSTFSELTIAYTSSTRNPRFTGWFTCFVEAVPTSPCECGWSLGPKITGGVVTSINEFPFMTAIVDGSDEYSPICGGAIISHRWIATAAHCFDMYHSMADGYWGTEKSIQNLKVLVGEHDLTTGAETPYTEFYNVQSVVLHGNYIKSGTNFDIALVKTAINIRWSRGVGPACLPFLDSYNQYLGIPVDIAGWGTTSFAGPKSTKLLKTTVPIVDNYQCYQVYPDSYDQTSEICSKGGYKDSCQHDSGGPLIWRDRRLFIIGLISHGKACGVNEPSVNTRISYYLDWILSMTQESYCYMPVFNPYSQSQQPQQWIDAGQF